MKKLLTVLTLITFSMGFSSCCSMFGRGTNSSEASTETHQVKTCQYDIVKEEVRSGSGKDSIIETIEKKVPRYKTVTKKTKAKCADCTSYYCPEKEDCGTTSEKYLKRVTAQGPVGSPHIGLVPTMRKLAE